MNRVLQTENEIVENFLRKDTFSYDGSNSMSVWNEEKLTDVPASTKLPSRLENGGYNNDRDDETLLTEDIRKMARALAPHISELEDVLKGFSETETANALEDMKQNNTNTYRSMMEDEDDDLDDELTQLAISEQALREELEFAAGISMLGSPSPNRHNDNDRNSNHVDLPSPMILNTPSNNHQQERCKVDHSPGGNLPSAYTLQDHAIYLKLKTEQTGRWYYSDMTSKLLPIMSGAVVTEDLVKDYCLPIPFRKLKCQKLQVENDCLKRQLNVLESRNRVTQRKLTKKLRYQNKKVSEENNDNDDDDALVDDDEIITSSLSNDSNKEKEGRHHRLKHRHRRKNTPSKGSLSYRRKKRKKKRRRVVMVCIVAPLFVSLTLWFYQSVRKTSSSSSYYMNTSSIIENTTTTAAINTKNVESDRSFSRLIGNMSSILIGNDNENNNNIGSVLTSTTSASTTTPLRDNLALVMREGILRQILFHDNKSYDIKIDNSEGSNIYSNDDADDDTDKNSNNSNDLLYMTENDYCPAIKQYQIQQFHDNTYSTSREDENNLNGRNDKEAVGLEKKEVEKKMKDERLEKDRIEAECIEQERQRQDTERLELERIDMEHQQQIDRLEIEREHQEKEKFELERSIKQEQQEKERIELERIASKKHERLVKVRLEREELEHIKQREEDSMHERLVKARLDREELERIEQIRTELEEKRNSEEEEEEKKRAEEKRRELEEERVHILSLEREEMQRIMELEEKEYRLLEDARERARALIEQEERTELTRLEAIAMEEKEMRRTLELHREKEESLATRKEEQKARQEAEEKALLVDFQRNHKKSYFLKRILSNLRIHSTINNCLKRLRVGSIVQYQIQQSNVSSTSREDGNNNNGINDEEAVGSNFQHNNNKKGNRLKRMFSKLKTRSRIDNGLKRILKRISIRQDHNTLGVWLVNRNDGEAAGSDFQRNDNKKANRLKNLRIRCKIDNGFKQILNKIRVRQDHNTLEVWLKKRFKRLKRIVVKEKTV